MLSLNVPKVWLFVHPCYLVYSVWVLDLDVDIFSHLTSTRLSLTICHAYSALLFSDVQIMQVLHCFVLSHKSLSYANISSVTISPTQFWVIVIALPSSLLILFCDIQFTEKTISELFI